MESDSRCDRDSLRRGANISLLMNYLDYSRRDRFQRSYFSLLEYFQAGDYWAVFSSRSNHVPHQISIRMPRTSTGQWEPSM